MVFPCTYSKCRNGKLDTAIKETRYTPTALQHDIIQIIHTPQNTEARCCTILVVANILLWKTVG